MLQQEQEAKIFVLSDFRLNTDLLFFANNRRFAIVDLGGGMQRLKWQQDLVAIHMQAHVGLDEQWAWQAT